MAQGSVTDQELQEKAAFALNTTQNKVKISNRENRDGEIRFVATTRGASHQCYIGVGGSFTGKVTSDALCSGAGSANTNSNTKGNASCNALSFQQLQRRI